MPNRTLNILIVEDHFDTAEILALDLKRLGHSTTIVGDGASAMQTANNGRFDLVFCDIGLPDGNGDDLFRQLNLIRPLCGIALTGFCMPDELRRFEKAGFLTTLEKPFHLGDIGKAIDRVLEELEPLPSGANLMHSENLHSTVPGT
jgi:CheY-like chemotaxis protein